MKPFVWEENMSLEETKNGAYWERNMMVLYFAIHSNETWDNFVRVQKSQGSTNPDLNLPPPHGWYYHEGEGFEGWSRVISLFEGQSTFHVPDDFDMGKLRKVEPNWDGHSTEEKWRRVMALCGIIR